MTLRMARNRGIVKPGGSEATKVRSVACGGHSGAKIPGVRNQKSSDSRHRGLETRRLSRVSAKADRKNFFVIARGTVQEWVPLLELASCGGLITSDQLVTLRPELETIAKMISGFIKGLEKRRT